jgi:hypothetical protein
MVNAYLVVRFDIEFDFLAGERSYSVARVSCVFRTGHTTHLICILTPLASQAALQHSSVSVQRRSLSVAMTSAVCSCVGYINALSSCGVRGRGFAVVVSYLGRLRRVFVGAACQAASYAALTRRRVDGGANAMWQLRHEAGQVWRRRPTMEQRPARDRAGFVPWGEVRLEISMAGLIEEDVGFFYQGSSSFGLPVDSSPSDLPPLSTSATIDHRRLKSPSSPLRHCQHTSFL